MSTPVTTGLATVQSRLPNPLRFLPEMSDLGQGLHKVIANGAVAQSTVDLMYLRAGQLLGSTYFTTRDTAKLRAAGQAEERITAVATWRDARCFTDAEQVAFELVEAVLTANPHGERVPDEWYARATQHYDDKAMWTLVMVMSHVGFYSAMALIAKPVPGVPFDQKYRP